MNKEIFKRKVSAIITLHEQVDRHVWSIFNKYIDYKNILFSCPDGFEILEEEIYFYGSDGCMGCYDPKSLSIPMKYFLDYEGEIILEKKEKEAKLKAQKAARKKEKQKKQKEKEERERAEYLRLKEKYENLHP